MESIAGHAGLGPPAAKSTTGTQRLLNNLSRGPFSQRNGHMKSQRPNVEIRHEDSFATLFAAHIESATPSKTVNMAGAALWLLP